jgi:CRISPR/Cas system-associated endonuclease Cas1
VAVYNPNGINFAIGTSQGTVYFGSIKEDSQGKARLLLGKIDCIVKGSNVSITSMQFS